MRWTIPLLLVGAVLLYLLGRVVEDDAVRWAVLAILTIGLVLALIYALTRFVAWAARR